MNLPNLLSLSRVAFLFVIAILLYAPFKGAATLAFVLYIIAALTDWADGWVARRFNMITDFGKLMDALADKVLNVGIFVVLVTIPDLLGVWAVFMVLIILTREFLITGLRQVAAVRGVVLAAEKSGKVKTVFQIVSAGFLMAALFLHADFGASTAVSETFRWIGIILLVVATLMTLQSGYMYLSKYWHLLADEPSSAKGKGKK
ncbi:CDP-diacylglycerol--glycerol-3-phosphate 3-phosphatidyltransferase [Rubellicoccus peritrichatus]|uniref:CDP-diacylglycerol--glycerol-3-phosphate 3-phosphatidyltransferase n=1 Tax=Rubellicoccus peritrichatus TaxID=3080537 RepID=A0AAQ3L8F0_9BACT|nr:CDP-diacylglycerol--glycerol-3-phosphate 3-phosphatidyltransferase [Puniceicoccus sp. CR14]WOO40587.1 CDP-diacylglycerol--glycerol-3-phosphate 3-phosphatidyltransferase [Puniceicoccus sp. CR14]